jgi:hypothetical protein
MINMLQNELQFGVVILRTVGGRVLGWYTEDDWFAVRKDDATFKVCHDTESAWRFIARKEE